MVQHFQPVFEAQTAQVGDAVAIFKLDSEGMRSCDAMLAWLDGSCFCFVFNILSGLLTIGGLTACFPGSQVDDGTACEIGIFSEWVKSGAKKGIVGVVTDLRQLRRRSLGPHAGLNLFVAGAVAASGKITWSVDEAVELLLEWAKQ